MYDRYTITTPAEQIAAAFNLEDFESFEPKFNAAPALRLPVITNQNPDQLQLFHWGLISKMANNKSISPRLFNLPKETALSRPMYKKQLASNRCVILADGFFVWKQISKKQQTPYYCYFKNRTLFAIAGIYEDYEDLEGNLTQSFNMLTVEAGPELAPYQDDMPAILSFEQCKIWLQSDDGSEATDTLNDCTTKGIQIHAVSPRLKDQNLNSEAVIKPAPPSDQHGNFTLFN